ncbi:MAG TPA: hypothetical protein VNX88_05935 [Terriglobales bacterium]|nr:hypothetical protein [Terriglobales bacterium]
MSDRDLGVNTRDYWILATPLSLLGIAALCFFYSRNEILLSGDAVAHISIARRVFDSRTPGPLQLGSVWLPLPHLLTIPFIIIKPMWQSGIGGSIVSVVSSVLAGLGLFRLLRPSSRVAAWIATAFLAANPNLLYVQSTALNEPLYLASFIWAAVFFVEASRHLVRSSQIAARSLEKGAIALTAAIFTRYDGWFLACICWAAFLVSAVSAVRRMPGGLINLRKAIYKPLLLTALGPTLWMAYNFGVYKNPLNFANGPYSAKAIAQRTTEQGSPTYPGEGHLFTAGTYFVKAAQLNIGEHRTGKILLLIAVVGSLGFAIRREWMPMVLLWSPLAFYSLSIAYGSVPIFVPVWWPFSYYNVRYGLELLPAIAAGVGLSVPMVSASWKREWARRASVASILVLMTVSYFETWRTVPICLREVRANGSARMELDRRLANALASLPPDSTILAYTGAHGGAFQFAGIPLRRTINEGIEFIWDASLAHPAAAADYVIAADDDPVARSILNHPTGLTPIASIQVAGQSRVVIHKTTRAQ